MKSKINKIITLDDGSKYLIMDQGVYDKKNYFLVNKVGSNGSDLTNHFSVFEEIINGDKITISTLKDETLLKALFEYFEKRANRD